MLKSNILEKANLLVHGERQKDYGHPMTDFTRTAKLWSAILGVEVTAEKVALCMMLVKISRLCQTPDHMDSVVDIAGYAGTLEMVIEKRKEK